MNVDRLKYSVAPCTYFKVPITLYIPYLFISIAITDMKLCKLCSAEFSFETPQLKD